MHTLIFSFPYSSAMGGGERYIEQLVEGLAPEEHSFTLVSSSRAMLDVFRRRSWDNRPFWGGVEPVSKLTVVLFLLSFPFFFPIIFAIMAGFRVSRKTENLICLSLADKLLATLPARLLGIRVVWMEHLVPGRSLLMNPYRPAYVWLSRFVSVVTVSDAVRESLARIGVSRARMRVITPGVAALGTAAQGPAARPVIGVVSRLSREKNVGFLFNVLPAILKEIPEARLHVYGDGGQRAELEQAAEKAGVGDAAQFFGFVDDRDRLYGTMRVLAVPSLSESFGIAALEAMARGVPVVASRIGGLPELVVDGETGILVDPDDESAWAAALLRILRDPELAAAYGDAGRERASAVFSVQKMLSAWDELLHSHDA